MGNFDLSSVTDCEKIFSYEDTVIFCGKNPWMFRKDGTYVAKYGSIRNAYNMVFLPQNTVLMDGAVDRAYHYISLDDGEVLWTCPQKGRRHFGPGEFAVSPDGKTVYFVYRNKWKMIQVDVLIPSEHFCTTYAFPLEYGATHYCYCDAMGNLCMLHSFTSEYPTVEYEINSIRNVGISTWTPGDPSPKLKYVKEFLCSRGSMSCICNDEYILFDDFSVLSIKNGESFHLLENSPALNRGNNVIQVIDYDEVRQYLTVLFIGSFSTIIIDCCARKIIAHYSPISSGLFWGRLIGEEFWIGTYDGVIRRPFPHMDEFTRKL